jgi:hypothetical protein
MPGTPARPAARIADCTASPSTSQLASRSRCMVSGAASSPASPRRTLSIASNECPNAVPMLRCIDESVRSRCSREVTNVDARTSNSADDTSRLASAFSNRIGLTLCGIVDEPTDPWPRTCTKYPSEM